MITIQRAYQTIFYCSTWETTKDNERKTQIKYRIKRTLLEITKIIN